MPNAPGGGLAVGPSELLRAREARAIRQAAAVAWFAKPLVSITIVTPGPGRTAGFHDVPWRSLCRSWMLLVSVPLVSALA